MLVSNWACKDGGDDYTGTKEEMTALLNSWKKEGIQQGVRYTVIPYNGENGIPPAFPNQPENSRDQVALLVLLAVIVLTVYLPTEETSRLREFCKRL